MVKKMKFVNFLFILLKTVLCIVGAESSIRDITKDVLHRSLLDNKGMISTIMEQHGDWDVELTNDAGNVGMNMSEYVRFFLYTRKNTAEWQELWINDNKTLSDSNFDSSKPTIFLIHGFLNNINSEAIQLPKKTLLSTYDCNVIGVDWSRIAVTLVYSVAAAETSHVGVFLADMIKFMKASGNLDLKRSHLIGHSLGAHVAGFAGKNLQGFGLARITGLDPAKPGFTDVGPDGRLSGGDALFVDCIHTCAGDLGLNSSICQADFYPNGGTNPQPGCLSIDFIGTCSHERSIKLYAESVYPTQKFRAEKCTSVPDSTGSQCIESSALMGQPASSKYKGIFYVKTNSEYPFAPTT